MLERMIPKSYLEIIKKDSKFKELYEHYSLEGEIEKKGKYLFKNYKYRYYKFFKKGKFLVYFEKKIENFNNRIKGVYRMEDIIQIEEVKNNKIALVFFDKKIILKFVKIELKNKWFKALNYFWNIYKPKEKSLKEFKKNDFTIKDKIDIQTEIELQLKHKLDKKEFDFENFMKDKNLNSLIEDIPNDILARRIFLSKIKKKIYSTDKNDIEFLNKKYFYVFLICNTPIRILNEDTDLIDEELLSPNYLPEGIKFNKLYFFFYEGKGDISGVIESIDISEVLNFNLENKFNFFQLSKYYSFSYEDRNKKKTLIKTKYAFLTKLFLKNLKKIKRIIQSNKLCKLGSLNINIDPLIHIFSNNDINKFKKHIKYESFNWLKFDEKIIDVSNCLEKLIEIIDKLNFKIDAINSKKPVNIILYQSLIKINYNYIILILQKVWYENKKKWELNDLFYLIKVLNKLENLSLKWKYYDLRFEYGFKIILSYYGLKLYEDLILIMKAIIKNITLDIFTNDNIWLSNSINQIKILNLEIIKNYENISNKKYTLILLKVIFYSTLVFQKHLKILTKNENISIKELIVINNSILKFISDIKEFIKNIKIKAKLDNDDIKIFFDEKKIISNYAKIQKLSYNKIEICFRNFSFNTIFKEKKFINLDIKKIIQTHEQKIKKIIDGINKHAKNNFWFSVLKNLVRNYILLFIKLPEKYDINKINNLKAKVNKDIDEIYYFFKEFLDNNDLNSEIKKLNDINKFLNCKDMAIILGVISNLLLYCENKLENIDLKNWFKLRIDFSKENYDFLYKYFKETYLDIKNNNKKKKSHKLSFFTLIYTNKFIKNLKNFAKKKKELFQKEIKNSNQKANNLNLKNFSVIDPEENFKALFNKEEIIFVKDLNKIESKINNLDIKIIEIE